MIFFALLISALFSVFMYVTRHFDHWKKKRIVFVKPTPFVGNLMPIIRQRRSIGEFLWDIYEKYENERFVGIFLADKPCLVVRDAELALRIMKQDFAHFNGRIITLRKKTDPIGAGSLFMIRGQEWKNTRARLSPMFTSKKQKVVFDAMLGVGRKMVEKIREGPEFELKELCSGVAVDMISDAVLGFDGQAISHPESDTLKRMGDKLFDEGLSNSTRLNLLFLVPEFLDFLGLSVFPDSLYQVMRDATALALGTKKKSGVKRGDYLDALLEFQEKGPWEGNEGELIVPDDENMVSQIFMFFTAGYETTTSALLYCLYEMALRQDIQEKLREELINSLENNEGKVTYESLNELKYLDNYINEVLRKHPPFPLVTRVCTRDYPIPDSDIIIEAGTKILISMIGLQNDEKYYENPNVIIPERFDDADGMQGKPYFPFTVGPRACLGLRFSLQVLKITVVSCLQNFRLVVGKDGAEARVRMNPKRFGNTPLTNIVLRTREWER